MLLFKNRLVNSIVVSMISFLYGFIFILIANHIEFIRTLPESSVNISFWEGWREFLLLGNTKYIGIITLIIGMVILVKGIHDSIKFKRIKMDEYELSLLQKVLSIVGITVILLLPILIVLFLSEPTFAVTYTIFFITVFWGSFSLTSLYFVFKI